MRLLSFVMLFLCSCVSPSRSPAQASSFESLPLCSRLKYLYSTPQLPRGELPATFHRQALIEAKQVWTASQVLARDTNGACAPIELRDLLVKPEWCRSDEWAGPYLDHAAYADLARMTRDEFEVFKSCWR